MIDVVDEVDLEPPYLLEPSMSMPGCGDRRLTLCQYSGTDPLTCTNDELLEFTVIIFFFFFSLGTLLDHVDTVTICSVSTSFATYPLKGYRDIRIDVHMFKRW